MPGMEQMLTKCNLSTLSMRGLKTQNENKAGMTEARKIASYLHDLTYNGFPAGSRKTASLF